MEERDAIRLIGRCFDGAMKAFWKLLEFLIPLVGRLFSWIGRQISGSEQNQPPQSQRQAKPGRDIHINARPNDRVHIHQRRWRRKRK